MFSYCHRLAAWGGKDWRNTLSFQTCIQGCERVYSNLRFPKSNQMCFFCLNWKESDIFLGHSFLSWHDGPGALLIIMSQFAATYLLTWLQTFDVISDIVIHCFSTHRLHLHRLSRNVNRHPSTVADLFKHFILSPHSPHSFSSIYCQSHMLCRDRHYLL